MNGVVRETLVDVDSVPVQVVWACPFYPPAPPADNVWQRVYLWLTSPDNPSIHPDHRKMTSLILTEMGRQLWGIKVRVTGLGRQGARELKALGAVAAALVELLSKVQQQFPEALGGYHQAEWLMVFLVEGEAIGHALHFGDSDHRGKDAITRIRGRQNRALNAMTNPFQSRGTRFLFDIILPLAEQSEPIAKALRAYTKARGALNAKDLVSNSIALKLESGGGAVRIVQGRKKK